MKYPMILAALLCLLLPALVPAQQATPSIVWQKCLGGSKDDQANSIIRTVDNGFLVVGSSKSNDGDVIGHHGSTDSADGWVVKVSGSGTIQWQLSLGGSGIDILNSVNPTADGGYICIGTTTSNDGDVSGNHGHNANNKGDIWVVKLSHSGSLLWSKCYGGSNDDYAGNIRENSDGTFYMIGSTYSNDGDVSGNHLATSGSYYDFDIWIVKLNSDGSIRWQQCFGGSSEDHGYDISEATGNSFYIAAWIRSQNGDLPAASVPDWQGYLIRMDSTKTILWSKLYSPGRPYQISPASAPNTYLTNFDYYECQTLQNNSSVGGGLFSSTSNTSIIGFHSPTVCFNNIYGSFIGYRITGPSGLAQLNSTTLVYVCATDDTVNTPRVHSKRDGFVSGGGPSGVLWKKMLGGSKNDELYSVAALDSNYFVVAGYTQSNDGDVSGNHGGSDFWLVKLGKVNTIGGSVFLDYNANGVKESNEPFVYNALVQSSKPGVTAGGLTDIGGMFGNSVDTGTYTTSVSGSAILPYYTAVPATRTSSFSSYGNFDSLVFALQPIGGKRDYSAYLATTYPARPGFTVTYDLYITNEGVDTLTGKVARLIKDHRLQFVSATPAPTSISGDTLNWVISTLNPRQQDHIPVQFTIAAPPTVNIGDTLVSIATIDSTGDVLPSNNRSVLRTVVKGAYDPNEKTEVNGGIISPGDVASGKYLVYTIEFQNTGNDTAFNITVRDTLPGKVDVSSIQMVGSSYPCNLSIRNGNQLTWTFTNILLPASTTNEPASHGYIMYRVRPNSNVPAGDTIRNSAGIYFDYNPPVQTQPQLTRVLSNAIITLPLPPAPVLSGLASSYCNQLGAQKIKITNVPPPADSVTVTVRLDGAALSFTKADSSVTIIPANLSTSQHSLMAIFTNSTGADTTTGTFNVVAAASPYMDLSSNISTVTSPTQTVTVTAINISGGGSHPLFTFGKDINFTTVLQAESEANQLTLSGSTLQVGRNVIVVRMRTTDTCYTHQLVIDSVIIIRNPDGVALPFPPAPAIAGLASQYCRTAGAQRVTITNLPAKSDSVTATARLDNTIVLVNADGSMLITPSLSTTGQHSLAVIFTNSTGADTAKFAFAVVAASTPSVRLTSDHTTVSGTDQQVVLTAINTSGGGINPVFTFARDKNFMLLLQAEGPSSTLTLAASTLQQGNNLIYVRMRTSDTCYTAPTAIDSLVIARSVSGGLTDPDFPGQPINAGPNPFHDQLIVSGLQPAKSYSIFLIDGNGTTLVRKTVSGQKQCQLNPPSLGPGIYLVWIYDEIKGQSIGAIRVAYYR